VIGVVVEHDVVGIPIPVVDVTDIKGSDAEVEASEPEAARATSSETPAAFAANRSGEATVLPRAVEMELRVIAAEVVSDPLAVVVDVGSFRMTFSIAKRALSLVMRSAVIGWRAAVGDISVAELISSSTIPKVSAATSLLRKQRD